MNELGINPILLYIDIANDIWVIKFLNTPCESHSLMSQ